MIPFKKIPDEVKPKSLQEAQEEAEGTEDTDIEDVGEGFSIHTLEDWGPRMPIGNLSNGALRKDFSLKDLEYPQERALGKFKAANIGAPYQKVVTKLLTLLLSKLGGESYEYIPGGEDDTEAEAAAMYLISKCYMADVIYMYVFARVQELGPELVYPLVHTCGYIGKAQYDLSQMKVIVCDDPAALGKEVELIHGMRQANGNRQKRVMMQPLQWFDMESPESLEMQGDETLLKLHLIKHSTLIEKVVKRDRAEKIEHVIPSDDEIFSLRKIDIEQMWKEYEDLNLGAQLVSEGKCKQCKKEYFQPVDATYESFFTTASLP